MFPDIASIASIIFKPKPREREIIAGLRDRCIVAETRAVLLEYELERARRPHREPRKDKGSVAEAKRAMTERLRLEAGKGAGR